MEIQSIVNELMPFYKKIISGQYAIALAGAHAKGKADAHSDLDIFVYTEDVLPFENRKAVFEAISPAAADLWVTQRHRSLEPAEGYSCGSSRRDRPSYG
ncbi:nucleotidyltransferase domain-containing protein [Paenibacillus spongiae]|uniref:Nucleotidyltransferase domain-containing protein n=1 Tax=Paenibacillus spongiae TaxID=2909671 RepID=A0ABY5SH09_9BACL|nr:nucleotidyltransferase domain-containing protein [Paenibacillus spongiae]UVI31543.1 nucleotidyltransferase domain-containing protein [Paenibacillus spongiae]